MRNRGGTLVLASKSPRRHELLSAAGIPHVVRATEVREDPVPGEDPIRYVQRIAREKALAADCGPGETILAADTTVVCADLILGKPVDAEDANRMLRLLSDRSHLVITGVCIRTPEVAVVDHEVTEVWFGPMSATEIADYVASGEVFDKAGSYGIQGVASRYITRIEGSYSNVVGLPVELVWRTLGELRNFPS